jgi:hypothetical protein
MLPDFLLTNIIIDVARQVSTVLRVREAYDAAIETRNQLNNTVEKLFTSLQSEVQELRHIGKDPLVFVESYVPTFPENRLDLTHWSFLCSFMGWDSDFCFKTNERYERFLSKNIRVAVVPAPDGSVSEDTLEVPPATPPPLDSPTRSTTSLPVEDSVVLSPGSPRGEQLSVMGSLCGSPCSLCTSSGGDRDEAQDKLMEGVETL